MKNRILIADDHQLFGEGLKELLRKQDNLIPFGPVKERSEIIDHIGTIKPQVLLLDINLGKLDGLELGKELKSTFGFLKIIMLTMYERQKLLKLSMQYGMDGYLLKDNDSEVLLEAIQKVLSGEKYFLKFEEKSISKHESNDRFIAQYDLSEREMEVITYLNEDKSNQEIAEILNLSYHTIKTHRKNIYLKLGVSNPTQLYKVVKEMKLR